MNNIFSPGIRTVQHSPRESVPLVILLRVIDIFITEHASRHVQHVTIIRVTDSQPPTITESRSGHGRPVKLHIRRPDPVLQTERFKIMPDLEQILSIIILDINIFH